MTSDKEYQKWLDARYALINALEEFKEAVEKSERNIAGELEEACDEAGLNVGIYDGD